MKSSYDFIGNGKIGKICLKHLEQPTKTDWS